MEQLIQEIANLKEQETAFLAQLVTAETEVEERALTNELNIVRNKLSEKELELKALQEKEQQRADVIEEKVHAEGVPFKVAGLDLNGIPVDVVQLIEEVVKVDRRRIYNEHAIELEQLENEHFGKDQERIRQYNDLEKVLEAVEENERKLGAEVNSLTQLVREHKDENDNLRFEMVDIRKNRDTAAAQLEEAQHEIQRLQSEIDDYQRAKVFGERQAQQIIDITPEETTTLQQKADAVKKLFTKVEDWGSSIQVFKPDGGYDLVKRAEFEAEWTPVVPELPSFRSEGETTAAESQDVGIQAPEVAATVGESFLGDTTEQQSNTADVNGSDVEHGGQEKTLEERVAKLEAAVFGWQAVA